MVGFNVYLQFNYRILSNCRPVAQGPLEVPNKNNVANIALENNQNILNVKFGEKYQNNIVDGST